jgi:hypothetical protein
MRGCTSWSSLGDISVLHGWLKCHQNVIDRHDFYDAQTSNETTWQRSNRCAKGAPATRSGRVALRKPVSCCRERFAFSDRANAMAGLSVGQHDVRTKLCCTRGLKKICVDMHAWRRGYCVRSALARRGKRASQLCAQCVAADDLSLYCGQYNVVAAGLDVGGTLRAALFSRESVLSEACGQGFIRTGTVRPEAAGFLWRTGSFLSGFRRSRPSASTAPVPIREPCHRYRPLAHSLTRTGFIQRASHSAGYRDRLAGYRQRKTPVRLRSTFLHSTPVRRMPGLERNGSLVTLEDS